MVQPIAKLLGVCVFFSVNFAPADEWPNWRGPEHNGVYRAPTLSNSFPKDGLTSIWRKPIGAGYSGIATSKGHVFTQDRPNPTKKDANPDGEERVVCLDAKTGAEVWAFRYPAHYGKLDYGNGPRACPTVFQGKVYTLGAVGMVCCLNEQTGALIWKRDMVAEFGGRIPEWGFAASPLVVGSNVVIHTGGADNACLVALNLDTGKEAWRSLNDPAGYATPILVDSPSGPQLIAWTPENIHGLDPKTGKRYWSVPYKVTYGVSISTPIYAEGIVFVSGYWEGTKAIQLGDRPENASVLWEENRFLRGLMAPPLYRDGLVYTLDKKFGLTCCELRTGKKRWDDKHRLTPESRNPQVNFFWIDETQRALALNSEGELVLCRFEPSGYRELSRTKILEPTWACPGFLGDLLFARNDKEIVGVRLPFEK